MKRDGRGQLPASSGRWFAFLNRPAALYSFSMGCDFQLLAEFTDLKVRFGVLQEAFAAAQDLKIRFGILVDMQQVIFSANELRLKLIDSSHRNPSSQPDMARFYQSTHNYSR